MAVLVNCETNSACSRLGTCSSVRWRWLARNEQEARRVLLSRLPTLEHDRLGGHTGGNLLLSMMERYSGDFLAAVDGLRALLGCSGRVWPVSVEHAAVCAEYGDGSQSRGEVEVDAGQSLGRPVKRIWLDPHVGIHPTVAEAIRGFDAIVIGPGSFYTSLIPIFLVRGTTEALASVRGPVVLVTNLLTEGRGMEGFTAGEAVRRISEAIGRPVDAVRQQRAALRRSTGALRCRAQEAPGSRRRTARLRRCRRRVLAGSDRAACPAAARVRGVERVGAAATHVVQPS